jgi:hypothetical protein
MFTTVRFKVPEKLHPIEVGLDAFVFPEEATVGHWRAALKYWQSEGFIPHSPEIKQMIKIADELGLSDDVISGSRALKSECPLLPPKADIAGHRGH